LCQRLFGSSQDYSCRCGILEGVTALGTSCNKCGVFVSKKEKRKKTFGVIALPVPMLNPFFIKLVSSLLKISKKHLLQISKGAELFVTPKKSGFFLCKKYFETPITLTMKPAEKSISIGYGIKALLQFLQDMDNEYYRDTCDEEKLALLSKIEWRISDLFLSYIFLIPPGYRDIKKIKDTVVFDSINTVYSLIFSCCDRIKDLQKNTGEDIYANGIFLEELSLLNTLIFGLFEGGLDSPEPLQSYRSVLGGKTGLIRGNLLGYRVNFSGRSVISSCSPDDISVVKNEVLLPYEMSKCLLTPIILHRLRKEYQISVQSGLELLRTEDNSIIHDLIMSLSGKYQVYLNRQPTLYRHGLMAFTLCINPDKSCKTIQLHPLYCAAFNADFDGDSEAVIFPITEQAQKEAKEKATFLKSYYYSKNKSSSLELGQEYIYGLWYATNASLGNRYSSLEECVFFCDSFLLDGRIWTKGLVIINDIIYSKGLTIGRYIEEEEVPLTKKILKRVIDDMFHHEEEQSIVSLLEDLTSFSAKAFTESGYSINLNDFPILDKTKLWGTNSLSEYSLQETDLLHIVDSLQENNLLRCVKSGSRGGTTNIKQMIIAKGILMDAQGNLLPPVKTSLMEGLSPEEFLISADGARKGLTDKSLSTAIAGWLQARIVKGIREFVIKEKCCGTTRLLEVPIKYAEDRMALYEGTLVSMEGDLFDELNLSQEKLWIRSPIFCQSETGVCQNCYGKEVSLNKIPEIGSRVGITAGNTVAEIVTQLILRTFHTSGSSNIIKKKIVSLSSESTLATKLYGKYIRIDLDGHIYFYDQDNVVIHKKRAQKKQDLMFTIHLDRGDISSQFDKLNNIIEWRDVKNAAYTSPEDGIFYLIDIVEEDVEESHEEIPDVKIHSKRRFLVVRVGDSPAHQIPFETEILVPFNTYVSKGDKLTSGEISYPSYFKLLGLEKTIERVFQDLHSIYAAEGIDMRSIHIELLISAILNNHKLPDSTYSNFYNPEIASVPQGVSHLARKGYFLQRASLGWIKDSFESLFTQENSSGVLDDLVEGTYTLTS